MYNKKLIDYLVIILGSLNKKALENRALQTLGKIMELKKAAHYTICKDIGEKEFKLATSPKEKFNLGNIELEVGILKKLKETKSKLNEQYLVCSNYKRNLEVLINKIDIIGSLNESELLNLVSIIIKNCFVNNSTLSYDVYFNEYLDKGFIERMSHNV